MNILYSFAYLKPDMVKVLRKVVESGAYVIVDSGAFSIMNSGLEITQDDYIEFIQRNLEWLRVPKCEVIQMDLPGDQRVTKANYKREVELSLGTIPVITHDMSIEEAVDYVVSYGLTRVCVAGAVTDPKNIVPKMYHLQKRIRSMGKDVSIHALGYTNYRKSHRPPCETFDNSTWLGAGRWGSIFYYDPLVGGKHLTRSNVTGKPFHKLPKWYRDSLLAYQMTSREFWSAEHSRGKFSFINLYSIAHYIRFAVTMFRRHGIRYHFAVGDIRELAMLVYSIIHLDSSKWIVTDFDSAVEQLQRVKVAGQQQDEEVLEEFYQDINKAVRIYRQLLKRG